MPTTGKLARTGLSGSAADQVLAQGLSDFSSVLVQLLMNQDRSQLVNENMALQNQMLQAQLSRANETAPLQQQLLELQTGQADLQNQLGKINLGRATTEAGLLEQTAPETVAQSQIGTQAAQQALATGALQQRSQLVDTATREVQTAGRDIVEGRARAEADIDATIEYLNSIPQIRADRQSLNGGTGVAQKFSSIPANGLFYDRITEVEDGKKGAQLLRKQFRSLYDAVLAEKSASSESGLDPVATALQAVDAKVDRLIQGGSPEVSSIMASAMAEVLADKDQAAMFRSGSLDVESLGDNLVFGLALGKASEDGKTVQLSPEAIREFGDPAFAQEVISRGNFSAEQKRDIFGEPDLAADRVKDVAPLVKLHRDFGWTPDSGIPTDKILSLDDKQYQRLVDLKELGWTLPQDGELPEDVLALDSAEFNKVKALQKALGRPLEADVAQARRPIEESFPRTFGESQAVDIPTGAPGRFPGNIPFNPLAAEEVGASPRTDGQLFTLPQQSPDDPLNGLLRLLSTQTASPTILRSPRTDGQLYTLPSEQPAQASDPLQELMQMLNTQTTSPVVDVTGSTNARADGQLFTDPQQQSTQQGADLVEELLGLLNTITANNPEIVSELDRRTPVQNVSIPTTGAPQLPTGPGHAQFEALLRALSR